jgi:hypothetical protein
MYGLFAIGVHAIVNWIDRKVAVMRAEAAAAEAYARQAPPGPEQVRGAEPQG